HLDSLKWIFPVDAVHRNAVRIAKDDLRAHVDELDDEEKAALEHLLVNEYVAFRLGSQHERHADKVRGEAGPWRIGDDHDRAVNEAFDLYVLLGRYVDVVSAELHFYAQLPESFR